MQLNLQWQWRLSFCITDDLDPSKLSNKDLDQLTKVIGTLLKDLSEEDESMAPEEEGVEDMAPGNNPESQGEGSGQIQNHGSSWPLAVLLCSSILTVYWLIGEAGCMLTLEWNKSQKHIKVKLLLDRNLSSFAFLKLPLTKDFNLI